MAIIGRNIRALGANASEPTARLRTASFMLFAGVRIRG
jgi:hypothetical protein